MRGRGSEGPFTPSRGLPTLGLCLVRVGILWVPCGSSVGRGRGSEKLGTGLGREEGR